MEEETPWQPDCLDKFLGWTKGSPQTTAATGFYMLRVVFATITVHSGIIFAGVITYEALKITNCLPDPEEGACQSTDDDPNDGPCTRLWGLIKPDSLFPILGTAAAIVLALSAAVVGTTMDVTKYRRQISYFGNMVCCLGLLMCAAIVDPSEDTILISTVGLFIVLIFKDFNALSVDAYAPELSLERSEVATAITTGYFWLLTSNVVIILFWVIIGFGMPTSVFGMVVSIGTAILVGVFSTVSYRRLPDVPPAHVLPEGSTIAGYTFARLKALILETYCDYTDLGIILLASTIFDPALVSIFAASVLVFVSEYNFTPEQTTLILGVGILGAIPAGPTARWVASTPLLNFCESETEKRMALEADKEAINNAISNVSNVSVNTNVAKEEKAKSNGADGNVEMTKRPQPDTSSDYQVVATNDTNLETSTTPSTTIVVPRSTTKTTTVRSEEAEAEAANLHPRRMLNSLRGGLFAVIVITLLAPVALRACDMGIAMVFTVLWGFSLSFIWCFNGMLRSAIVPGGREAEFAGLRLALFSAFIWLPLLVFSIANEAWSIVGAMYLLNVFLGWVFSFCALWMWIERWPHSVQVLSLVDMPVANTLVHKCLWEKTMLARM